MGNGSGVSRGDRNRNARLGRLRVRLDPDPDSSESALLGQYLDYQRETMFRKTDGLTREQLALKHAPSELTLAGLLYHLALVEEDWMEVRFSGLPDREPWIGVDWDADPNWEFRTARELEPEYLRRRYREAASAAGGSSPKRLVSTSCRCGRCEAASVSHSAGCSCTSSRRRHVTSATPTSFVRRSTAQSASSCEHGRPSQQGNPLRERPTPAILCRNGILVRAALRSPPLGDPLNRGNGRPDHQADDRARDG